MKTVAAVPLIGVLAALAVKVGGYGSCGLYAVDDPKASEQQKGFVPYLDDFLAYVTDPKTEKPPEAKAFDPAKPVVLPARSVLLIDTGAEPNAADRGIEKKIFAGQG